MNTSKINSTKRTAGLFGLVSVAVVLIISVFIIGLAPRLRQQKALAVQTLELSILTVSVVSPVYGKETAGPLLPAEIKPWTEAPIYARASGYLRRWMVDLGARVKKGQMLAEIETPELDQELDRTAHELAEAEAALSLAKATENRYARLTGTGSVSEQEITERQSELALQTARVKAARSNLRRLKELKSFAMVKAPFDGVITAREVDTGDLITSGGAKELFRLAQIDRLRIYVRVPQPIASKILPGQTADVLIPELPGKTLTAKIVRLAGAISADSRTMLVELNLGNPNNNILAGGFAQVRIKQTMKDKHLILPGNTLLFRAEGPQIGVVKPDGKVELRSVKLGRDFGKTVEILAGVSQTDRIILNPPDSLTDNAVVRIAAKTGHGESK
jgi:RND family efflux transporter MFP subunit